MQELTDEIDVKRKYWLLELDRPYGDYRASCKLMIQPDEDDINSEPEFENLPKDLEDYFKQKYEPHPVSAAE